MNTQSENTAPKGVERIKTPDEIILQLIDAIEPLKIKGAKNKAEKFVNVGIEAVKRLFIDNKSLIINSIQSYAGQQRTDHAITVINNRIAELERQEREFEGNNPCYRISLIDRINDYKNTLKQLQG